MALPMHNRRPHAAASRGGSNAATMRHQQQQQQQQHQQQQRQHNTASGSNGTLSGGNEGIVQKLQGVIAAIRGDRNREHRNRDIAMEKLRSTKEAFHQDKAILQADKDKYVTTQNESENTQNEILNIEKSMQELQQKYEFQHEDLIRKREKINQQKNIAEVTTLQREKATREAHQLLDQERIKTKDLERSEEKKTADLLAAFLLAGRKGNITSNDDVNALLYNDVVTKNLGVDDFVNRRENLEKKQEEALSREFTSNVDYAMYPQMIEQKAKVLDMEAEAIKIEVNRLEAILVAMDNEYPRGIVGKDSTMHANPMINNKPQLLQQQQSIANDGTTIPVELMDIDREDHLASISNAANDGIISSNVNEAGVVDDHVMMENDEVVTKEASVPLASPMVGN